MLCKYVMQTGLGMRMGTNGTAQSRRRHVVVAVAAGPVTALVGNLPRVRRVSICRRLTHRHTEG